jgi:Bacterial dnaA protein helix-turn-helix
MLQSIPVLSTSPGYWAAVMQSEPQRTCHWAAFCVARDFRLDMPALFALTRGSPRTAFARQVAMYLAHTGFEVSFGAIGRAFDRDRTTVAHACRVIEDGRDDIWLDCRLEALGLFCQSGFGVLSLAMPELCQ